jgi:hypothetical protein
VIIGLGIGSILVGQELMRVAAERAQISQIEKFNTAANTFYGKYGYLPGDINAAAATQFGFTARGPGPGEGDGDGFILYDAASGNNQPANGDGPPIGEIGMFWVDLTTANGLNLNLIEGSFSWASPSQATITHSGTITGTGIPMFRPEAKIGGGNYIQVFSPSGGGLTVGNYFGIATVASISVRNSGNITIGPPGMTVKQAYDIDSKMDDGKPMSGRVMIVYGVNDGTCTAGGPSCTGSYNGQADVGAVSPSATTCADNNDNTANGALTEYSMSAAANYGNGLNCALSFRMQAGD